MYDCDIDKEGPCEGGSHGLEKPVTLECLHSDGKGANDNDNEDEEDDECDLQDGQHSSLLHGYIQNRIITIR